MRDRDSAVSAFYADESASLVRAVGRVVNASPLTIEDACSYAWCQLVRRSDDIRLGREAYWWLYRVAVRQGWKLAAVDCRQVPAGGTDDVASLGTEQSVGVEELAERREVLRSIDRLPARQRRLLLLHALGYTYDEIARMTGDTRRTVDRQLRRTRETLRQACRTELSRRELQVIDAISAGHTSREIATRLGLSVA